MPVFEVSKGVTRSIQYSDFVSYVTQFSFTESLRELTQIAWKIDSSLEKQSERIWLYSHVARALLANGPNAKGVIRPTFSAAHEEATMLELKSVNQEVSDSRDPYGAKKFFVALSYSSFHFQDESMSRSVGRFLSLLCTPKYRAIQEFDWNHALGVTLEEYFLVCLALFGNFLNTNGVSAESFTIDEDFSMESGISCEKLVAVLNRLAINEGELRGANRTDLFTNTDFYSINPLISKPIIKMSNGALICPINEFLLNAIGSGLYYIGSAAWGRKFSSALGQIFELYVEDQLKLLNPELLIKVPTSNEPRCDWILKHDGTYFLIESKIPRMDANSRSGGENFEKQINKIMHDPIDQINFTYQAIMDSDPAFVSMKIDKRLEFRGLVVSLEPFYLANSIGIRTVDIQPLIPVTFCHAGELEILVSSTNVSLALYVLIAMQSEARFSGLSLWEVMNNFPELFGHENPIIEAAMKAAGWSD